ncbi:MAG TPA: hypothetical protein VFM96_04435 [Gaiellaceae bacterium]|nr:hypothetical protein [Gaiellaceae bacterium]
MSPVVIRWNAERKIDSFNAAAERPPLGFIRGGSRQGSAWQPVLDRHAHQRVPCGIELDLVDPFPVTVVRPEFRRALAREPPPIERLAAERDAACTRSSAHGAARRIPSTNGRFPAYRSYPVSGGGW